MKNGTKCIAYLAVLDSAKADAAAAKRDLMAAGVQARVNALLGD